MTVSDPQELLSQAEKKANSTASWFMGNKYEEAADLYTQAANQFRQSKRCKFVHSSFHLFATPFQPIFNTFTPF